MQPGFPVEIASKGGLYVTAWSDQIPQEIAGLFGGSSFRATYPVKDMLMGFACGNCGFVELYRVSQSKLQQFLDSAKAQPSQPPEPAAGPLLNGESSPPAG